MTDTNPSPETLELLPELTQATVSPDGRRVAFYYDATGRNEVHVLDLETGDCEQYTDGEAPASNLWPLAWTADGERVLYHHDDSDGGERRDVYTVDATGETEPVVETDGTTTIRAVGPDGETLLVRSNHEGDMDAYLHDLASGDRTRLTDAGYPVWRPILSTDATRVAYPGNDTGDPDNRDVHVCNTDGEVERVVELGERGSTSSPKDWGPDDQQLLVSDDATGVTRCGVYDLAADDVQWFGNADYVEEPQFFLPDGERFVATRKRAATTTPVVYDVESGEGRELDLPDGVARFGRRATRVVDDDRILVVYTTPTRRPELLVYDLATDEYEPVFERDYGPYEPADFVEPVYETVASDGTPETPARAVEHDPYETFDVGTLFYDAGARPSPLVVFPHGGPHLSNRRAFDSRAQYLCQCGYAVLQVNYRGSSGRGRAFSRALHGDWGGAEQGDVATAVEHVLAEYDWLDEDRVAVYGGSFGGFSALWQLLQYPDLYAAGAGVVAMTDLPDMYENTVPQFRSGFLQTHLGTPDENPDLYRERSPVTHAGNLNAPLLLVHGTNDPRVPVSQARNFRDALLERGYDQGEGAAFEYRELDGSGHFGANADEESPLALLTDFLDRRL
ncbi:S9 family peptidase [Halobacterium wangiae]|uniref:S9 family peptidase n=1 Tax=Halobacterium wangiae TaxID=2902623 RepID=UPI001E4D0BC5|nr:alpha/beta fold hydrolase [Halobacterium wangiae]